MRSTLVVLSLIAVAATSQQPQAPAGNPPGKAYLVFPVRTELQRQYYFTSNEQFFLMIHGDSLIDAQGKVDPSRLGFDNLLGDDGFRINRRGNTVRAHLYFAKEPPEDARRLLRFAIRGWMHDNDFEAEFPVTIIGDHEWHSAVKLTGHVRGLFPETESEDGVGDESVRAYPVRTVLSRLMTGEANCVVVFPQPFGKDADGTLNDDSKARVKELVTSLKLKERKRIEFGIWLKDNANGEAVTRFTEKTAPALAKELGFEYCNIAHRHVK